MIDRVMNNTNMNCVRASTVSGISFYIIHYICYTHVVVCMHWVPSCLGIAPQTVVMPAMINVMEKVLILSISYTKRETR